LIFSAMPDQERDAGKVTRWFNATGERIQSGGMWCVYELSWHWMRLLGTEFHYPERPKDLPPMSASKLATV
jgi:hypothetical protein